MDNWSQDTPKTRDQVRRHFERRLVYMDYWTDTSFFYILDSWQQNVIIFTGLIVESQAKAIVNKTIPKDCQLKNWPNMITAATDTN